MKSNITGCRYVLAVKNLDASANFYKTRLGFETLWKDGSWHFLIRDKMKIMPGQCPDDLAAFETGCHSYFAYIELNNIDELYNEYKKGVETVSEIENKPWGQREFGIQTIDGHRITFGEEIRG